MKTELFNNTERSYQPMTKLIKNIKVITYFWKYHNSGNRSWCSHT